MDGTLKNLQDEIDRDGATKYLNSTITLLVGDPDFDGGVCYQVKSPGLLSRFSHLDGAARHVFVLSRVDGPPLTDEEFEEIVGIWGSDVADTIAFRRSVEEVA